jgi:tetratricopeptide (TPR) repeat protein
VLGANRAQHVGDVGVRDPRRLHVFFGVDRQPVAALGHLIDDAVAGVIDEQVVVGGERAPKIGQGPHHVVAGRVLQGRDGELVVVLEGVGDRSSVTGRGLEPVEVAIGVIADHQRVVLAVMDVALRPGSAERGTDREDNSEGGEQLRHGILPAGVNCRPNRTAPQLAVIQLACRFCYVFPMRLRSGKALIGLGAGAVAVALLQPAHAGDFTDCVTDRIAIERGFPDRAIHYCSRALKIGYLTPNDIARVKATRGAAYQKKKDLERATNDFEAALAQQPESADILILRGVNFAQARRWEAAIESFTRALELEPANAIAFYNRGLALLYRRDYEGAVSDFGAAIGGVRAFTAAHYNRGLAHFYAGRHEPAIADFTEAIRLRPDFGEAFNNRAHAYEAIGDKRRAAADIARAVQLRPDDPNILGKARDLKRSP